jgi:hypothetical protein
MTKSRAVAPAVQAEHADKRILLRTAREARDRFGWTVIPVRGKVPVIPWKGLSGADPRGMPWERATGLAVLGGKVSDGLVIRDFDLEASYIRWAGGFPDLAQVLPTARTAKGFHLYFRGPEGFKALGDGEYRGDPGHYTLIPPSLHPSGKPYQWLLEPKGEIPWVDDPSSSGLLGVVGRQGPPLSEVLTDSPPHPSCLLANMSANREVVGQVGPDLLRALGVTRGWCPPPEVGVLAHAHRPRRLYERNRRILAYVRALKRLEVPWEPNSLRIAFRHWWAHALPVVGNKSERHSYLQFLGAWGRCPAQTTGLDAERTLGEALGEPLHPRARGYPPRGQLLARVCARLQRHCGQDPFYLSGAEAGRLLGVTERAARRLLGRLVGDGILRRVSQGSNLTGLASTYRYRTPPRG